MYGDKLDNAIKIINEYVKNGNSVALYKNNDKDFALFLKDDDELKSMVWNLKLYTE